MIDTSIITNKENNVSLEVIYQSKDIGLFQCDNTDRFYLIINKDYFSFRVCEFIVFKRKILEIDLPKLFDMNSPDYHCINMVHCKRVVVLSISELLLLRKVIDNAMLKLRAQVTKK